MVIADRICVMNQGHIAQIGAPEEIYERPRTRFAASFIGKTNLLRGRLDGKRELDLGEGIKLPVSEQVGLSTNGNALVCLRPHNIQLLAEGADLSGLLADGFRKYAGHVSQRFYFGDAIDYQVDLNQHAILRVIAPSTQKFEVGANVNVLIHPRHCVAVQDD